MSPAEVNLAPSSLMVALTVSGHPKPAWQNNHKMMMRLRIVTSGSV
jgi:hypothetical protein